MIDGVKTINSAVRTLLLAAVAGIIGVGAYFGYHEYTARERTLENERRKLEASEARVASLRSDLEARQVEISELNQELTRKQQRIEQLETSMKLLKVDQRLARLNVLEIERDEQGEARTSRLEFFELSPGGEPLSEPRQFELPGDVIYIDNWIVKFDDQYVEQADIERGTSLCLFRRIFSEQQSPNEGISLDEIGSRPQAYARGGAISEFEQQLWSEFWEFANDPEKAAEMGVRAANGEAVSIQVREGKSYHISLRASGGLSIFPAEALPKEVN